VVNPVGQLRLGLGQVLRYRYLLAANGSRSDPCWWLRSDGTRSIVLSPNKPFVEWSEVFPHSACTITLIDRLLHRAEIIDVEADTCRFK